MDTYVYIYIWHQFEHFANHQFFSCSFVGKSPVTMSFLGVVHLPGALLSGWITISLNLNNIFDICSYMFILHHNAGLDSKRRPEVHSHKICEDLRRFPVALPLSSLPSVNLWRLSLCSARSCVAWQQWQQRPTGMGSKKGRTLIIGVLSCTPW